MKKERIFWFSGILSFCMMVMLGMSLAACSSDEFDEDYNENPVYQNPVPFQEDGFKIELRLSGKGGEYKTVYEKDEPIYFVLWAIYEKNFEHYDALVRSELLEDDNLFAVYKKNGKLFRKIERKEVERITLLSLPPVDTFIYQYGLPPGDYYTKFTVKYNSTPGAEEKVWKTHTFRMDFKVVDNNH